MRTSAAPCASAGRAPRDTPRLLAAFCWSLRSASHLPTSSLSLSLSFPFNLPRPLPPLILFIALSLSFQLCLCCVLYRTFVIPTRHSFSVYYLVCYVAAAAPGQALSSHGPYVGGLFFSDLLPSSGRFPDLFFFHPSSYRRCAFADLACFPTA